MGELRFDGQVAVVTGAGRGLGRAYARSLAARGARVVVNDLGGSLAGAGCDPDPAAAVVDEIGAAGGEAVSDTNTVATADGGRLIVETALQRWGRVDIVVNNAGTVRDGPFASMLPEEVDPLIDVHLRGAFHVTRPAWDVMCRNGYGRIVNTTSAAGLLGAENMSNYGSAKTGIVGLTRVLAAEGSTRGIRVNAVAPIARTRMLLESIRGPAEELMQPVLERLDPDVVAPVVVFLSHPDCPVSGEIFSAGAGRVSRFFIGRTAGFGKADLCAEDVRDHLDVIRDETDYTVPAGPADEMIAVFGALG